MVLVERDRILPHSGMGGSGIDDGDDAAHAAGLVIGLGANLRAVIAVPVVEVAQVGVVRAQVLDTDRGAEQVSKSVQQAGQLRPLMRCGQKEHATRLPGDGLLARVDGIARLPQQLLGQQAAQAVTDEEEGTCAEAFLEHQVQHLGRAIGERHGVPGIAAGAEQLENPRPARRAGGVVEGPHADLGKLLSQPVRPGGGFVLAMPPRTEGIAAQAVNEDDVRAPFGAAALGDHVQPAQSAIPSSCGVRTSTPRTTAATSRTIPIP